jgi:hypothetical protein
VLHERTAFSLVYSCVPSFRSSSVGKQTAEFKSDFAKGIPSNTCFSLMLNKDRGDGLHLVASDDQTRNATLATIKAFWAAPKKKVATNDAAGAGAGAGAAEADAAAKESVRLAAAKAAEVEAIAARTAHSRAIVQCTIDAAQPGSTTARRTRTEKDGIPPIRIDAWTTASNDDRIRGMRVICRRRTDISADILRLAAIHRGPPLQP